MTMTWARRIAAAHKRGAFTPNDLMRATAWQTCAVGEAVGLPKSEEEALSRARKYGLYNLRRPDRSVGWWSVGIQFVDAVQHNDFHTARAVLTTIAAAMRRAKASERKKVARG